jgi:hypothetical protein
MPVAVVLVVAVLPRATGTTGATNASGVSAWYPGTSGLVIDIKQTLGRGLIAGAVGTTALNATTYADMVLRARPASTTPEMTVQRGAEVLGVSIPGEENAREARKAGLGPLLGTAAGVGAGLALTAVRSSGRLKSPKVTFGVAWVLAMAAGNGPMTVLGVTDPRTWSGTDWVADIVPHAAYAAAATATLLALES